MIEKRGKNLGFDWQEFQTSLNQYYVISLILFIPIALGLYLLWKKRSVFYMLIVISFLLQILLMVILLGPSYFWNDNTFTDKILLLVILVNSSIYRGLLKKEDQSGKISFFDQD
jgi:phosphoglycerol transferase MdoB-like AlkP superfamily enzyme